MSSIYFGFMAEKRRVMFKKKKKTQTHLKKKKED